MNLKFYKLLVCENNMTFFNNFEGNLFVCVNNLTFFNNNNLLPTGNTPYSFF